MIIISNAASEFIEFELEGLSDYISGVFSSTSNFGQTKRDVEVYLRVCESLKIKPEELYHIGDNYTFDYLIPRGVGINTFLLDRGNERRGQHIVRNLKEFEDRIRSLE